MPSRHTKKHAKYRSHNLSLIPRSIRIFTDGICIYCQFGGAQNGSPPPWQVNPAGQVTRGAQLSSRHCSRTLPLHCHTPVEQGPLGVVFVEESAVVFVLVAVKSVVGTAGIVGVVIGVFGGIAGSFVVVVVEDVTDDGDDPDSPGDTRPSPVAGEFVSKSYSVTSTISQEMSTWPASQASLASSLRTE
jgi:hypothetical protein